VRWCLAAALLAVWPLAGQDRSVRFVDDVIDFYKSVRIARLDAAIIESGRVVWQNGKITARAPEEPVIAERVPGALLDTLAPVPAGATIRQVLSNTADGTPGEEVLENRAYFEALHRGGALPNAAAFAMKEHGTLSWFEQQYAGERILWCHSPEVLIVRLPAKNLALVISGNLKAARLEDGNVLRSMVALLFLQDVAKLGKPGADNVIDSALDLLQMGQREGSAALARLALNRFPELESMPDVTLLYLFSQLGLPETEASATAVIKGHPSLPTAWFYYGQYLENSKRYREAAACFEKITMHQPPWHNWTVAAAKQELTYLKTY
jgi:hypothetical protein